MDPREPTRTARALRPPARVPLAAAALLAAGAAVAACGSPAATAGLPASAILHSDAVQRVVDLRLVAGENDAYGGFNFDGYGNGQMTVSVPVGWQVRVSCQNASTTLTHSCAVIADAPIATSGARVVFGASTPSPTIGLPFARTARFSFVAARPGRFRIACLVTAHEADGMWDWLVVRTGGSPSVRLGGGRA